MPYISLSMAGLRKLETAETDDEIKRNKQKNMKVFRHPIRNRIVDILRDGEPRTQQELGTLLSMSNAGVHYHVKLLLEVGVIKLDSTRSGPKGITEKLYTIAVENWPDVSEDDLDYYLSYMVSWIYERNREGLNILKSETFSIPFLTGSYSAKAPLKELIKFKRDIECLFNEFYSKCESFQGRNQIPFAVTFSMIPSQDEKTGDSRNILEYEPEHPESIADRVG
jgi:DNA-binding Lrp family transcriptional regulator